jgi:CMP-N-acetylneuraminic acid synthetase
MRTVAIIPARGGSRGIARKNLAPLRGVPLIAYTIQAAKAAKRLDGCWVSTEDAEIAGVARTWGAEVLARPGALATDEAPTAKVLLDALGQLAARGVVAQAVVTLQPTSPLREPGLIDRAVALLEAGADTVLTVTRVSSKVGRLRAGQFEPAYPPGSARQALEPLFAENGNVYVTRREVLAVRRSLFGERLVPLEIDRVSGLDIDTPDDLALAEVWLERYAERFQWQEVQA